MDCPEMLHGFFISRKASSVTQKTHLRNSLRLLCRCTRPPNGTRFELGVRCSSGATDPGVLEDISKGKNLMGGDVFSVTSSSKSDVDYLGESTKGNLNVKEEHLGSVALDGQEGPIEEIARIEAMEAETLLNDLGMPAPFLSRYSPRGIFCSRTLNLRSISVIGYDMDYTLIQYNVMVSLLIQIGKEALPSDIVPQILATRDRRELAKVATTAPPHGLFLMSVNYNEEILKPPPGSPTVSFGRNHRLISCKLPFY